MTFFQRAKFHDFYYEHYRTACLFLLRYQLTEQDAEDIVQHVFVEMWEKIQRSEPIDNLKAYLYVASRNRAFRLLKDQELRVPFDEVSCDPGADSWSEILEEEVREASSEEKLWALIDHLPPERRKIFLMAKKEGRKYQEIANELNISVKTVENQIGRALKSLREKAVRLYIFLFS